MKRKHLHVIRVSRIYGGRFVRDEVKDRWVPGFSLHMQRERGSPT